MVGSQSASLFVAALGLALGTGAHAAVIAGPDSLPANAALPLAWVERTALARNPSLSAMREGVRAARAHAEQAGALEDPTLDAMLAPRSLGSDAVDPAWRVELTQSLPLFGQRGLRRSAATAEAEAAAADFETARLDLLRDVRQAYFDYYLACRGEETSRELVSLMGEARRVALARYSAGAVEQADPLQAETELAMLEHEGVTLGQHRRSSVARLRALLHLPQGTPLPEPPRELPLPTRADSALATAASADPRRPELAAADASVRAREAGLSLARREGLPGVGVSFAWDRYWSEPELQPSVGLSLTLPLNRGRLAARAREEQAGLARAQAERLAARDRIDQRIEEASASLGLYLHDVEIMHNTVVPASEHSLKAIRAAYEANRADFRTLIGAARDLARAKLDLHQAEVMALEADAEMRRALATDVTSPSREDRP